MRNFIFLILCSIFFLASGCSVIKENEPTLHVIGVYEGSKLAGGDDEPSRVSCGLVLISADPECVKNASRAYREVIVNVSDNSSPIILALNAYEKTEWKVKITNNAKIKKIVLSGYEAQKVSGIPENIPIEIYTYKQSPCNKCFQGKGSFYSYSSPPSQLKAITGLEVSSFQGKYRGEEFSIFNGMKN